MPTLALTLPPDGNPSANTKLNAHPKPQMFKEIMDKNRVCGCVSVGHLGQFICLHAHMLIYLYAYILACTLYLTNLKT